MRDRHWLRSFLSLTRLALGGSQVPLVLMPSQRRRALVIIGSADLNSPTPWGATADKIDPLIDSVLGSEFQIVPVLLPLSPRLQGPTVLGYLRAERSLFVHTLLGILEVTRHRGSRRRVSTLQRLHELGWSRYLKRNSIDLVIGIGLGQGLMSAAREQGIGCIEVQHGLLSPQAIDRYWPTTPECESHTPDLVLTWDTEFSRNLAARGIRSVVSGPGLIYSAKSEEDSTASRNPNTAELSAIGRGVGRKLVLTSWNVPVPTTVPTCHVPDPTGVLGGHLFSVLHVVTTRIDPTRLTFRLHPVVAASRTRRKRATASLQRHFPGSEIDDPRQVSLRDGLANAETLLSAPSAAVFDAAIIGKPLFIAGDFDEGAIPMRLRPHFISLDIDPGIAARQLEALELIDNVEPFCPAVSSIHHLRATVRSLSRK